MDRAYKTRAQSKAAPASMPRPDQAELFVARLGRTSSAFLCRHDQPRNKKGGSPEEPGSRLAFLTATNRSQSLAGQTRRGDDRNHRAPLHGDGAGHLAGYHAVDGD